MSGSKLAIVGAGSVGTSLAYAALIRGSASNIALFDVNAAKVEAEVLDLAHGTQFASAAASVTGSGDIAVAAQKISGLPTGRIFSSGTVLDTSRLRWLLARRAGVAVGSVHASIIGEHGDTEFPAWSTASIGPIPVRDWKVGGGLVFTPEFLAETAREVTQAAYKVIAGKGATNYAIGLSGARIVEAILRDEHAVLPVSTVLDGQHGISGVALSLPSIVGHGGVHTVLEMPMDDGEVVALQHSAETLRNSLDRLGV